MSKKILLVPFFFALVVIGLGISGVGAIIPAIAQSFSLPYAVVGSIFLFQGIGYFLSLLVGGVLGNIISQAFILRLGFVLAVLGFLGIALFSSFPFLVFAFSVMGVGVGWVDCMVNPIAASIFTEHPATALNFIHAFFGLGSMIAPRLYAFLTTGRYDWRDLYLGITVFTAMVLLLFLFPFVPRRVHAQNSWRGLFKVFRLKAFWFLGLAMLFYSGGVSTLNGWCVSYLAQKGVPLAGGSLFLSYFWLGLLVGRLLLAPCSDRFGHLNVIRVGSLGGVLMTLLPLFLSPHSLLFPFFLFIAGLSLSIVIPTTLAYAIASFPETASLASGWVLFNNGFGILLFPWLGGIVGSTFDLGVTFATIPVFLLLMFLCQQFLEVLRRREG